MRKVTFALLLLVGSPSKDRIAFIGLHGGVFEQLERFEKELNIELEYLSDKQIHRKEVDLASYRIVLFQHLKNENRELYEKLISSAKGRRPDLRIFLISGDYAGILTDLTRRKLVEHDPEIGKYYGSSPQNLRRLLNYLLVRYLGRAGKVEPPLESPRHGLYHPDHEGLFSDAKEFLTWLRERGRDVESSPRALVAVHLTHLMLQQPRVVDALIREFERQGVLAVAALDNSALDGDVDRYGQIIEEFEPDSIIHLCHSSESAAFRERVDVPHLHSVFFKQQSIDQWRKSTVGLAASELAFQVVGQELIGAIEPQIGAGTKQGGGSAEAFTPIPDRIEHLVARAASWMRLRRTDKPNKRIAFVYWDREMGKAELMRGSATGMFMNGPRSIVNVLKSMKDTGYQIDPIPADEDELIGWMMERGRQIGIWAPGVLDRLARSGTAVLVPAETYRKWFEEKVPEHRRRELIEQWGEPPGKFLVWEKAQKKYIVIPRIDLGNVILLPQPLRGEAHDTSLVHDKLVPPPHNYLATYFWLQEEFKAHALVHFGTHGTEFLLPGKPVGLSGDDWSDIVMGSMPNINPWIINNLGESSPIRRRAYAVLIDHLVPPSVNAELADELLNLHNDIDKWAVLEEGALKKKFRASITAQVRDQHLDRDLHIDLASDRGLAPADIMKVASYLHDIRDETTPVSLHVFGEPPRDDLLIPYLVTCLRKGFLDALGEVIHVPLGESVTPGDREKYLRKKAEEVVELVIRRGLEPAEAIKATGGRLTKRRLPKGLEDGFDLALKLNQDFARTHQEIDNLLRALDGRFIPPGPGNSPDRNPAVVPTGRNMYVMNPEEVPSRPSWEIGKALVAQLLKQQLESTGRYPGKIGFTLNSFATFQDYGVMESQILYLIGVRPVWDARNLVVDVELIPAVELGRRRIDVFIAGLSYYRDMLPTRMRLLDKAIRLAAGLKEKGNLVHDNSARVRKELEDQGLDPERAAVLSRARIFGYPPGQFGSAGYYYLVEKSGEWHSREELINIYLEHVKYAYTKGLWGEEAPLAYDRQIQGTEVLLRSWSDRTRSPLSNKYDWYHGGSLSLAVKQLTGKEPEFFLSDVRDPDRARMVDAEDALREDFRVRLFNRKWIEGMMKEGYAGADQIAKHVSNTMGWKIMREESVSDDIWEEIVEIYLRDSRNLHIREWFEAENPFALQELTEILLETIRKGYWHASEENLQTITSAYLESVARHGPSNGLLSGDNRALERYVREHLAAPGAQVSPETVAAYEAQMSRSRVSTSQVSGQVMRQVSAAAPNSTAERMTLLFGAIGLLVLAGFVGELLINRISAKRRRME